MAKNRKFTVEEATAKRDSLDYVAQTKKAAALSDMSDFARSQELMKRADKDYDDARKFDNALKKVKKNIN